MNAIHTPGATGSDEIDDALDRLDQLLAGIRREAGHGTWPAHENGLAACLRVLRGLGADAGEIALDLTNAARCALEAAQPDASLRVLEVSRRSLAAAVRQAQWPRRQAA